jgi:hypothetical protein
MLITAERYGCEIKTAIFDFEKDNLDDLEEEVKL